MEINNENGKIWIDYEDLFPFFSSYYEIVIFVLKVIVKEFIFRMYLFPFGNKVPNCINEIGI